MIYKLIMIIQPYYEQIDNLIESLIKHKIMDYDKTRNYAGFGKNRFNNVSGLSVFISKGLLKEKALIKKIIKTKKINAKFIQEIFWRIYWQGWLENYPVVWENYKKQIIQIEDNNPEGIENYSLAINGNTKIEPFNEWVNEIKSTGYLHNHVRMWFASIWIHYLGIPWQLGQKFFYENLLDADLSSNLLSWRWVAGIQTQGKKYIATEENINKYTSNRYLRFKLPKISNNEIYFEDKKKSDIKFAELKNDYSQGILIITENNLSTELLNILKNNIKFIILIRFNITSLKKSKVVRSFYENLYQEYIKKNSIKKLKYFEVQLPDQTNKFIDIIKNNNVENLVFEYLRSGYEKDIMSRALSKLNYNIKYHNILDKFYLDSWKYCEKGFFKFKEKIPILLNKLV